MKLLRGIVSRRLLLSLILLVFLALLMGVLAYWQVLIIRAAAQETRLRSDARQNREQIRTESIYISNLAHDYVLQDLPEDRARVRVQLGDASTHMTGLFDQVLKAARPEEQKDIQDTQTQVNAYIAQAQALMDSFDREGRYGTFTQNAMTRLNSTRNTILDAGQKLVDNETKRLIEANAAAEIAAQQALNVIIGGGVFIILLSALIGYTNVQTILVPLATIQRGVEAIAGGRFQPIELRRRDEFGTLAQTFNAMMTERQQLYSSLEQQVAERTAQLQAGAEVARAASSILDPQELLQQTVDLICDRFDYYYAAVFLIDEDDPRYARLRAGRGEAGQKMLAVGHKFEMGSGMVGWVCANKQARIALDVGQDAVRFANPLLPDSRSEIALPLQVGGHILGALDVQSTQEAAFDESNIATLQSMADQIAVALENARSYTQAQESLAQNEQLLAQIQASLKETTALYAAGQAIASAQDNSGVFESIVENILQPEIDLCMLVLFDVYETDTPQQLKVDQIWVRPDLAGKHKPVKLPAGARFEFASFALHEFMQPDQHTVVHSHQVSPDSASHKLWEGLGMEAIAFVPLNTGAHWIGALGLGIRSEQGEHNKLDENKLRPYRAVAGQAATALENRRLIESAQASLQELRTVYRSYTREAWEAALQARPGVLEYDHVRAEQTTATGSTWRSPLVVRDQEIGKVELERGDRPLTEQERALAEAVITQAALALDSARLFDQTQRLAGRERLINKITAQIRASGSVSGILQIAARELAQALNVPHAVARIQPADETKETEDNGESKNEVAVTDGNQE